MQFRFTDHALFPDAFLADFKLRLDQCNQPTARFDQIEACGQHGAKADKAGVADDDINGVGNLFGRDVTRIGLFHHDNPVVIAQFPVKLPLPDINRKDLGRTVLQKHIGKTAGRGSDINAGKTGDIDAKLGQTLFQA